MDFFDIVKNRFSYRGRFEDKAIPKADLDKILQAALLAPSGCNAQTTGMVVVTEPQQRKKVADTFPFAHRGLQSAPVLVVVYSEKKPVYHGRDYELQDCAAFIENFLLAATALGYASVWTEGMTEDDGCAEKAAALLGIPAGKKVRAILPLGIPEGDAAPKQKEIAEGRLHFEQF